MCRPKVAWTDRKFCRLLKLIPNPDSVAESELWTKMAPYVGSWLTKVVSALSLLSKVSSAEGSRLGSGPHAVPRATPASSTSRPEIRNGRAQGRKVIVSPGKGVRDLLGRVRDPAPGGDAAPRNQKLHGAWSSPPPPVVRASPAEHRRRW